MASIIRFYIRFGGFCCLLGFGLINPAFASCESKTNAEQLCQNAKASYEAQCTVNCNISYSCEDRPETQNTGYIFLVATSSSVQADFASYGYNCCSSLPDITNGTYNQDPESSAPPCNNNCQYEQVNDVVKGWVFRPTGSACPTDNLTNDNPPDNDDGSNPPDNGDGSNPPDNGDGSNPPDNGDGSNPPDNGDGSNPPDNGDGSNPPDNGDGSNPPDNGDGSNGNGFDDSGIIAANDRTTAAVNNQTNELGNKLDEINDNLDGSGVSDAALPTSHTEYTLQSVLSKHQTRLANAEITQFATNFMGNCNLSGNCPVINFPANEFYGSMSFDLFCTQAMDVILTGAGWLILGIAAFSAFRIAVY